LQFADIGAGELYACIQERDFRGVKMANYSDESNGFGNFSVETIETVQSERVSSSRVIDLRRHPRVDTRLQARMITENGKVEGRVTNLSRSGLRFEAGSKLADLLKGSGMKDGHPPEVVELCFDVPTQNAAYMPVVVGARVVHVTDNEEGNYMCGVEFRVFAEGDQALIDYLHTRGVAT
jgi:hypothetical protein